MYNLYYSKHCQHCQQIFRECNTNGLALIDIDEVKQYPNYILNVPTIEDVSTNQLYVGKEVIDLLKTNNLIEPFEYDLKNTMNTGFSFINSSVPKYSQQDNYSTFT
jgi:hypothetical protein